MSRESTPRHDELETPVALVEVDRLLANLQRASRYCRQHGLAWRPHAKTHKTPELAALQVEAGAVGVTVATLAEAEEMARTVDDILLAYPPLGAGKLRRLRALPEHLRLGVALDSLEALEGLSSACAGRERPVDVLVELDLGMHRVGVPEPAQAVELAARAADAPGLRYAGILFYPGHVRDEVGRQGEALAALSVGLERFLAALGRADLPPDVVSGGSTPTLWRSHEVRGLTEIRPGTNIFNDRTTAVIGACDWDDCAYSVLATVVSTSVPGQAVVDAGAKALAKEELRGAGGGYGARLDRPELAVRALSEEHGVIDLSGTEWRPRVGERVRIVPNHVCVSVNLQERLYGVRGDEIVEEWVVAARRRLPA